MIPETKSELEICAVCGRRLENASIWGPGWLTSRYCSESCSERRLADLDFRLQEAILLMLGRRPRGHSVSAAEVAKFLDPLGWRSLMVRTHNAARRLAARGMLVVHGSETVATGPWDVEGMRFRLPDP